MDPLVKELRHSPLTLAAGSCAGGNGGRKNSPPLAHTLLFVFAVLAIVPLAALLSRATEAVAEKTGDTLGGLLNATLGNLREVRLQGQSRRG